MNSPMTPTEDVVEALKAAQKALKYSINSLDGVVALDEEDEGEDGGSAACQATVKINKRALAKIEKALQASLSLSPPEGWRPMPAPTLERVVVAGWQKRHGTTIGYWWYHEDATDDAGTPIERPDALLWVRLTDILPPLPASPVESTTPAALEEKP